MMIVPFFIRLICHRSELQLCSLFLVACSMLSGCGKESPKSQQVVFQPQEMIPQPQQNVDLLTEIPSYYQFLGSVGLPRDAVQIAWDGLPYDRIEFERTACLGQCPTYIVSFNADGSAHYIGREYAPRACEFDGEISVWDYGRICWLIDRFNLLDGPHDYGRLIDAPLEIVRVKSRATGKVIEIADCASQGPIELWALFSSLDAVADRIEWAAKPNE